MLIIAVCTYYASDVRHAYEASRQLGLSTFSIPPLLWLSLFIYALLNVVPAAVMYCVAVVLAESVRDSLLVTVLFGVGMLSSGIWWLLIARLGAAWFGRHRD